MDEALAWVTNQLISSRTVTPASLLFLIRHYLATGRLDVRDAIEAGLTQSLIDFETTSEASTRVQWLFVCDEASSLTDAPWMAEMVRRQLPAALDALEASVRAHYEPGCGMIDVDTERQMQYAVALLDAFALAGRVPYAMLAEELCRTLRKQSFDPKLVSFGHGIATDCVAVSLLYRLAGLHRQEDYVTQAVVAADADYEAIADALAGSLDRVYRDHPAAAAQYGLARLDRFALRALPN